MQPPQVQGWPPFVTGHNQYLPSRTLQVSNKATFDVARNGSLNMRKHTRAKSTDSETAHSKRHCCSEVLGSRRHIARSHTAIADSLRLLGLFPLEAACLSG
jgi:hypothetical protein